MNDIRNCYLPEIPVDFDTSTILIERPHILTFQTSSGRRKFVGVFIVVCLAVGATMYINYISRKADDERIN
jgi:hypothetical protein